jgi:hypothetical protein
MNTNYSQPLSNSIGRMKKALFQPFNLSKWINIGFTAFLSGLTGLIGGSGVGNPATGLDGFNWDKFFSFPESAWLWISTNPFWSIMLFSGIFLLLLIAAILSWISSRGKFMFLYNVANNHDDVVKPWHEYRQQGNSFFWWQFVYGWIVFVIFALFLIYSFGIFKYIYYGSIPSVSKFGFIFGLIVVFIMLLVCTGYISLFLNDFIVPVIYKHRISATKAWSKFIILAVNNMGSFIVYGLFILILKIAVGIAVLFLAVMTCCVGLLFIMIPFVGSVILLPVSYTFRAFSIEYFAMFGDEFELFQKNDDLNSENIDVRALI